VPGRPVSYALLLLLLCMNNKPGVTKPVVFMAHGVTLASDSFTILNANESIGFIMADAGGPELDDVVCTAAAVAQTLSQLQHVCQVH
jgi:hypothetical protein